MLRVLCSSFASVSSVGLIGLASRHRDHQLLNLTSEGKNRSGGTFFKISEE